MTIVLCCLSCQPTEDKALRIAVAANLRPVMTELAALWQKNNAIPVDLSSASSGVLTAQIESGAPFHAFFSANSRYPAYLHEKGLGIGPPKSLVGGKLILWTKDPLPTPFSPRDLGELTSWAQPNPDLAPYGIATEKWLKGEKINQEDLGKRVLGENVGQVNQFIYSRTVDAAFTAASAAAAPELKDIGHWYLLDQNFSMPHDWMRIHPHPQLSAFEQFLHSESAARIFAQYGYQPLF